MHSTAYERKSGLTSQTWRPPLAFSWKITETAVNIAAAIQAGNSKHCGNMLASAYVLQCRRDSTTHVIKTQSTSMSSYA